MANDKADVLAEVTTPVAAQATLEFSQHLLASTDYLPPAKDNTKLPEKAEIVSHLPPVENFAAAEKAAGLNLDPATVRDEMAKHIQHDLANGSLKPEAINGFPRVGGAFVATGAVTEAEMDQGLARQQQMTKDLAASGAKPPRIGDVLADMFKSDPDKVAKIHAASTFYDELHKLSPGSAKALEFDKSKKRGSPEAPSQNCA